MDTPNKQGYIFPAEWEKHASTWLTYPKPNDSWPNNFEKVCDEYNAFIKLISESEKVHIVTDSKLHSEEIFNSLDKLNINMKNVDFFPFKSDDAWCRDHGPAFLKDPKTGKKAIVKWEFNAWGGKYPSATDNEIGDKITREYQLPVFRPGIIMEGGSIEVNGSDMLLTTKSCLLNKNRNARYAQAEIENYLSGFYGYDQIIWLNDGIEGDDTDGHIDDIARFVNENTVLAVIEKNKKDKNFEILRENFQVLKNSFTGNSKPLNVVELIMPDPLFDGNTRLPCSYANFYITNKHVIVPVFGSKKDEEALKTIQACFPDKNVTGLFSGNVIFGLGSWHCLSQQEPE